MKIEVYTAICGEKDNDRNDVFVLGAYDRFKDHKMNAKIYKVLPHLFLKTDWSIWVDGNLYIKKKPEWYVEQVMKANKEVGVFQHSHRDNVYQEGAYCIEENLENEAIVNNQLNRYEEEGFKHDKLSMGGVIVRKHTENVIKCNEKWWGHISVYSKRDQLSLDYCFRDKHFFDFGECPNQYFYTKPHRF